MYMYNAAAAAAAMIAEHWHNDIQTLSVSCPQ